MAWATEWSSPCCRRKKPSLGPLAGDPWQVALVEVAGDQRRRMRVGASDKHGRHAADVGREPRGVERADEGLRRHQHLAAEMAALLFRGELVLEVDAGGAGLDHRLHQLEALSGPPKPASASAMIGANQ